MVQREKRRQTEGNVSKCTDTVDIMPAVVSKLYMLYCIHVIIATLYILKTVYHSFYFTAVKENLKIKILQKKPI